MTLDANAMLAESDKNACSGPQEFRTSFWRSSADFSRPAGDKPQAGDYILDGRNAPYRIVQASPDGEGWVLKCEPAPRGAWNKDPDPSHRVFDWVWRTKLTTRYVATETHRYHFKCSCGYESNPLIIRRDAQKVLDMHQAHSGTQELFCYRVGEVIER